MPACRTLQLPILAFLLSGCAAAEGAGPRELPHRSALADSLSALAAENMATWNRLDPDRWLGLFDDGVQWYYRDKRMDLAGVEQMARTVMPQLRESRTAVVGEPHVVVLGPDAAVVAYTPASPSASDRPTPARPGSSPAAYAPVSNIPEG